MSPDRPRASPFWRILAGCLATLGITLAFVWVGFPYDRLAARALVEIQRHPEVSVRVGQLSNDIRATGPGVAAVDVDIDWRGNGLTLKSLAVRPDWSPAWLTGTPVLWVEARGLGGEGAGAIRLGKAPRWTGGLSRIDLASPALRAILPDLHLAGRADVDAEIELSSDSPVGRVEIRAWQGSLSLPGTPIQIPFEAAAGTLVIDGGRIVIERLRLEGPSLELRASGPILGGATRTPLDLKIILEPRDAVVAEFLRSAGVPVPSDGPVALRLAGSLSQPILRPLP